MLTASVLGLEAFLEDLSSSPHAATPTPVTPRAARSPRRGRLERSCIRNPFRWLETREDTQRSGVSGSSSARMVRPRTSGRSLGAEGQRPGRLPEAELDQQLAERPAEDGLAVDALQRDLADAPGPDRLGKRLEGGCRARIAGLDQRERSLARALQVEHRLGPG